MARTKDLSITVKCHRCDGTGHVLLSKHLAETLLHVGAEWVSTADIVARMQKADPHLKRNTITERLSRLRELDVAESRDSQNGPGGFDWRRVGGRA